MLKAKKVMSLLLAIVLIFSVAFTTRAAEISTDSVITVKNANTTPGSTVDVDIVIENNPGILGMTLKLEYDDSIATLTEVKKGEALDYMTFTPPQDLKSGCNLPWDAEDVAEENIKDGVIATLTFKIADEAEADAIANISVSYDSGAIIDKDMNSLKIETVAGSIQVIDYMPGDLNEDGLINTTDVVYLRRYIAGGYGVTINEAAADVNADGMLNTTDVVYIRRYIAGGYGVELKPSHNRCEHTMTQTVAADATCTKDGNIAYWYCSLCEKYFANENGATEISLEDTIIDALGHSVVIDEAVEPTYTTTGLTEGSHCSACNAILVEQTIVPVLKKTEYAITYQIANNDTYLAGLDIENPNPAVYSTEDGLNLVDLIVPGYTFEGWYDGAGSSAKKVEEIAVGATGDVVLYAHWSLVEYTVKFDCPLDPVDSITYTVDQGATLSNPYWFGYNFVGWSDDEGNLVSSIKKGTTGNITLKANWTSLRNQTRPVSSLADPIIVEDEENGVVLFTYEIGTMENVPLYTIKDFGNVNGITVTESITTSDSISEVSAESVAEAITKATTSSSSWTLSKDWNKTTSISTTHSSEVGSEVLEAYSSAVNKSDCFNIGSNYNETDVTYLEGGLSAKLNAGASYNVGNETSLGGSLSAPLKIFGIGADAQVDAKLFDIQSGFMVNGEIEAGADLFASSENTKNLNTNWGYNACESVSSNSQISSALSQRICDTYGYGETYSEGGSESQTQAWANTSTDTREYGATFTYSTAETTTTTKTYSNEGATEGYYRLVCAGKVHVFAVVGYDIATQTYFTYTYNVLDDETSEFLDYSKTTGSFDDYENGVLPFEVPIFVNEYIDNLVLGSEGLVVDIDTGKIVGYNGNENDNTVIIPSYMSVDNGDGTKSVVKVTGIESDVFKNNEEIVAVKMGKFITDIPSSAFEGCTSLEVVAVPNITTIGDNAFANCTSLKEIALSNKVTSLGVSAFKDVQKVTFNAENAAVAENAVYSGAKQIVLNLADLSDSLGNTTMNIVDTTEYFEFNGNNKTFTNLKIASDAETTVINAATFENTTCTPLELSSENVTLNRVTANSEGLALILKSSDTQVDLFGTVNLTSGSGNTVLCKNTTLGWANPGVAGKLNVSGNVLVCGEIQGESYLNVSNGEIKYITESEYETWLNSYNVYFNANGGTVSEASRQVNYSSAIGTLPVPTRDGYAFEGWYTADGTEVTSETVLMAESDVTLEAKWTLEVYTANWNTGTGYTITVKRTSSPNANASIGTISKGSNVYYGDVLSITYSAKTNYKITAKGETTITVTGNVTAASIYAKASLNAKHLKTISDYTSRMRYYIEIYSIGDQLYLKGWLYDSQSTSFTCELDLNYSTFRIPANLSSPNCPVGGNHGFEIIHDGSYSGTVQLLFHTWSASGGNQIQLWNSTVTF